MDAVINLNNYAVRIISEKNNYSLVENSINFDTFGRLFSFELMNIGLFIYLQGGDNNILLNDRHLGLIPGYFKQSAYKLYINGQLDYYELTNPINKFDYWELAQKGDLVEMRILDTALVGFWHEQVYEFKVNLNENGKPRYTEPPFLNTDVNSDTYCILTGSTNPAADSPYFAFDHLIPFYSKHTVHENGIFDWTNPLTNSNDRLINSTRGQDGEEISFATFNRLMIYICWGIYNVYAYAIDALTMAPKLFVLSASKKKYYEFNNLLYHSLSISDQIIADLFWEWGLSIISYQNQSYPNFTIPKSFNLSNNNTGRADEYHEMYSYYSALKNCYLNLRYINSFDQTFTWSLGANPNPFADLAPEMQRMIWLFRLHPKSVGNFLSPSLRLKVLDYFIQVLANDDDSYRFQQILINVLKLYNTPTEANELLDYLLIANDTENTNFKILYENFDDTRIHRYPIVGLFADSHTYRMQFIHYIYQLWKISKYNFYYIPQGVNPLDDVINPNCFFLTQEGRKYFEISNSDGSIEYVKTIIEIEDSSYSGLSAMKHNFKSHKIKGNTVSFNYKVDYSHPFEYGIITDTIQDDMYTYHLYQPISLINLKQDLDLTFIPNGDPIPAFLPYYATEYAKLKKFDAALSFAIELGLEAGLFLIGGGIASVRHLTHLRHFTKIKHLHAAGTSLPFGGGVTAETAILVWRGAEAGSTMLSINASVIMSLTTYKSAVASAEGNQEEMLRYQKISKIFLFIALGSAGASILSRNQAMKYADDVLNSLPTNGPTLVPDDVLEVLVSLKSIKDVKFALFQNRINNIYSSLLGQTSHIPDFFNGLNSSQKSLFFKHFENYTLYPNPNSTSWKISDIEFWIKMNQTIDNVPAARLDLWKNAPIESIALKKDMRHLDGYVHMIMKDNEFHFTHFTQKIFAPNSSTPIGAHLWEHYHIMNAATILNPQLAKLTL